MWAGSSVQKEDLEQICASECIPWEKLRQKTVLVTGATGLIGTHVVNALLYAGQRRGLELTVLALARNEEKGRRVFGRQLEQLHNLRLLIGDIRDMPGVEPPADYIIHGASPTSSRFFVEHPVETLQTALCGAMNVLKLAREHRAGGCLLLSTMEVYGHPPKGGKVTEEDTGAFSPAEVRNSYPIGKLACESLCCSYAEEYHVPAKVLRLTQTFGPGVEYSDGRIFAEFARCGMEKRDIVLKTKGETERSYLYTADAVTAILTALLKGISGHIYTAANEKTYCTIYDMARLAAELFRVDVAIDEQDVSKLGYAGTLYMDLDTRKLRALGWEAKTGLRDMYARMVRDMAERSS